MLFLLGALFIYKYGLHKPDRKPPTIVATFPKNYTRTVAVDIKNIRFVFSEKMETSLSIGYVGKQLPIGTATWEDAGQTVLSVPVRGPLPYQTSYTFVLSPDDTLQVLTGKPVNASMKDVAGNEIAPFFFNLRTELSPETKELRNKYIFNDLFDTDEDGLEDELELKIGTDPAQVDTDADGLMDYDEYCKYKTDATKSDSDGDGKIDSDWHERREYTYTIRAVCEINDPVDLEDMNDLFQDARIIAKRTPTSHTRYEVLLYPDSEPYLIPTKFPYPASFSSEIEEYTRNSFTANFSPQTQNEIRHLIVGCRSDLEVIERIQLEMAQMRLVYEGAAFLYCRVEEGNQLVMVRDPLKDLKPKTRRVFRTAEQLLDGIFYGDSMFRARQHGVCDSRATLRATMLKAAGIPTRLTLAIPLVYCYRGKEEELTRNLKRESLHSGYVSIAPKSPKQVSIVNHNYTEVYVNNKWIRLDQDLNEGPIFNDKYLFLKIISFADWADVDFTRSWSREKWFTHRPYKTLELSDTFAKYPSVYGNKSLNSDL